MKGLIGIIFVFMAAFSFGQSSMGNLNMPTSDATFPLAIAPYSYEVTQVDSNLTIVITGSYTTSDNLRDVYGDGNYYVLSGGGGSSNWDKTNALITPIAGVDSVDIESQTFLADGSLWFTDPHNTTNVMIGDSAGGVNTPHGDGNIGIGENALLNIQGGTNNIGIGTGAGKPFVANTNNVMIGTGNGDLLPFTAGAADGNTAIGFNVMVLSTDGSGNVGVGMQSLAKSSSDYATAVGYRALFGTSGSDNSVAIGRESLFTDGAGANQVAVGAYSLYSNTGTGNVALGFEAGRNWTGSNALFIDNTNTTTPLIFGDFSQDSLSINGELNVTEELTIDSATLSYNSEEGVLEMTSKKWSEVALQMGLEDWILGYNNTGSTIPNGTPVYTSSPVAGSQYKPTIDYSYSTFAPFAQRTVGITTMDIPNGELGLVAERGEVRGLNTTGLSTSGALWLSADSSYTSTKPGVDTTLIILGGVLRVDNDSGVIYVDVERFLRESDTKSFTFTSQGIGSGTYYMAGFYEAPSADANLTQASPTVTYAADANSGHASHPFVVCGGAGTVDAGVVGLEVTGTYVDDQGNEGFIRDTIISDITAVALNEYYEAIKFTGVDTFRLIVISGSPTTYSLDFNYGFAKYDDWFNQDFWITGIETTGLAAASDASFDMELLEHTNTGWTYSAAAFTPGNGAVAQRSVDMTKDDLYNGKNFAWKRDNLTTFIEGTGIEGFVIRVTTGANNSVQTMNTHVRVTFD